MKNTFDYLTVIPTDSLGGGAEQLLYNLIQYNAKIGKKCRVIFLSKKTSKAWETLENQSKISYLPFKSVYLGYLFIMPLLIYLSFTNNVKYTLTSQTLINAMMGFLKKIRVFKKTKIIARESNSIFHLLNGNKLKMYSLAYKIGYSHVDLVICQTEYMQIELLKEVPWIKHKTIFLNNPVNIDLINEKSKESIDNIPKGKYIIAAGRLSPVKGFDILIYSFKILLKKFPELNLVILGTGTELSNLKEIISKENLNNNNIVLQGFVNNVYPYFKNATMCVLSSRIEGFPNVLLQMMSQNNKVVSTKSAGGIDKVPGVFTCEINDVKGLATAMENCLLSETNINRTLFDEDLKSRTLENFMHLINLNISNIKQ